MNQINSFKDITVRLNNKFENSILGKQAKNIEGNFRDYDFHTINEVRPAIKNKMDGLQREHDVYEELEKQYSYEKGYSIIPEAYLRDKDGKIVKDFISGEARRIDFIVVKDDKVIDSIEVTSKTADKTIQSAKEERIRDMGGNYIRDNHGNIIKIADTVHTRIERRD
ncbi:MAG: hypothetical protein Q4E39_06690 [bacterium]|nr:hypothetical protein [bacterium]